MPEKDLDTAVFRELSAEILKKGHVLRFQARGISMHPFIKDRDVIKVKPVGLEDVKSGDIVFYMSKNKNFIAHRLIKKIKDKNNDGKLLLVTKGDSCTGFDAALSPSQVLGKVISIERDGKEISMEKGISKLQNFLLSKASPFSFILYPIGRKVKKIGLAILRR